MNVVDTKVVTITDDMSQEEIYRRIYGAEIESDIHKLSEDEVFERVSVCVSAASGMVCIPVRNREGDVNIIGYAPASPDNPNVTGSYALGDFVDEYGDWHPDGLPDGVTSIDPNRSMMVPVFGGPDE